MLRSALTKYGIVLLAASFCLTTNSAAADCDGLKLQKELKLKDGTVRLGTKQVSAKNQNPVVAWAVGGKQVFCRDDYDTSAVDARAVAATADKDHLYVVFSADGGSSGSGAFSRFTQSGWIPSYGKGGGPKVLVVLKLRKSDGEPVAGTYIIAKKNDGKTNSVAMKRVAFFEGAIGIEAEAWFSPLKADKTPMQCSGSSPFAWSLTLSPDLKNVKSSSAANCN